MTAEHTTACPPHHTAYPSEQLARNAVALHRLSRPGCHGYNTWACGEHWHCGHTSGKAGRECKADEQHQAAWKRIDGVSGAWR